MPNPTKYFISPNSKIRHAIEVFNKGESQVALVVDTNCKLVGVVTDGDIRCGIINNLSLDREVSSIMTKSPIVLSSNATRAEILQVMRKNSVHHIPLVDGNGCICSLEVLVDQLTKKTCLMLSSLWQAEKVRS